MWIEEFPKSVRFRLWSTDLGAFDHEGRQRDGGGWSIDLDHFDGWFDDDSEELANPVLQEYRLLWVYSLFKIEMTW